MSADLVKPDRIDNAAIEQGTPRSTQPPSDPLTRDPIIDQKMGLLGKAFGYGDEKKGNLAVLGFIFSAAALGYCMILPAFSESEKALELTSNMVTPLVGLLSGIIGYVTGHKSDS